MHAPIQVGIHQRQQKEEVQEISVDGGGGPAAAAASTGGTGPSQAPPAALPTPAGACVPGIPALVSTDPAHGVGALSAKRFQVLPEPPQHAATASPSVTTEPPKPAAAAAATASSPSGDTEPPKPVAALDDVDAATVEIVVEGDEARPPGGKAGRGAPSGLVLPPSAAGTPPLASSPAGHGPAILADLDPEAGLDLIRQCSHWHNFAAAAYGPLMQAFTDARVKGAHHFCDLCCGRCCGWVRSQPTYVHPRQSHVSATLSLPQRWRRESIQQVRGGGRGGARGVCETGLCAMSMHRSN